MLWLCCSTYHRRRTPSSARVNFEAPRIWPNIYKMSRSHSVTMPIIVSDECTSWKDLLKNTSQYWEAIS